MATVQLFKPLNMFSPPRYELSSSDESVDRGYSVGRWIMKNDLRFVTVSDGDLVKAVALGKPSGLHFLIDYADFELTANDRASFDGGRLFTYLHRALAGDDLIIGSSGVDAIKGFTGNDTINGQSGNDLIYGSEGSDFLLGNMGNDSVYGGDGDDFLAVGRGSDKVFGNAGSDWVVVEGPTGVTVDLTRTDSQKIGPTATAQFSGIENIIGTTGSDRLFGNSVANIITASNGNDVINGRAGGDTLAGGTGSDTLTGGDGLDTFAFQPGAGRDFIKDFVLGYDEIFFTEGPTSFEDIKIIDDGRYAVVVYGSDWIRLENVDHTRLFEDDFIFA